LRPETGHLLERVGDLLSPPWQPRRLARVLVSRSPGCRRACRRPRRGPARPTRFPIVRWSAHFRPPRPSSLRTACLSAFRSLWTCFPRAATD